MVDDGSRRLGEILQEKHRIPKYQREYAWKRSQIVELWTDIIEYLPELKNESKYIYGQMIAYKSPDCMNYVIDGQQRLTTSYLFLAAARQMINRIYPSKDNRTRPVERFVNTLESHTFGDDDIPLLCVAKENKTEFKKILDLEIEEPNVNSKSNMVVAYSIFLKALYSHITKTTLDLDSEKLDDYNIIFENKECYDMLKSVVECYENFFVLYISVTQLRDAYRIFDTVNTRGIKLDFSDLVKNYVFTLSYSTDMELQDDDYGLENDWNTVVKCVGGVDEFKKFLRYVLIAKYGTIREDEIMAKIKEKLRDAEAIRKFIKELKDSIGIYLFITKKQKVFKTEETNRILNGITDAKNKLTVYAPLLIAFNLQSINHEDPQPKMEEEALKLVKALDVALVRGIFLDKRSNFYENDIGNFSREYYCGEITFDTMIDDVYSLAYSDTQFENKIKVKDWTNVEARYILTELYNRANPTNVVRCTTDVEHILPQDIENSNEWDNFSSTEHDECFKKIGNLMLLVKKVNSGLGNSGFGIKKNRYIKERKNALDIDLDLILSCDDWTVESIEDRTEKMAKYIVKYWPKKEHSM